MEAIMRTKRLKLVRRNGRLAVQSVQKYGAFFWTDWKTGKVERRISRVFPCVYGGVAEMNYNFNFRKTYRVTGNWNYYPRQFQLAI